VCREGGLQRSRANARERPPAGEPLPLLSLPSVFFYASAFLAFSTSSTRITRMPAASPLALP
jgi:hypothetical protein